MSEIETQSRSLEIAKTIRQQILFGDPAALMAWGAEKFMALPEQKLAFGKVQLGGLQFKVNGAKFRGFVIVRLMGNDTYTIVLRKVRGATITDLSTTEDVYCDELMTTIDRLIERD